MAQSDSPSHSYCLLYNAITDCIDELESIQQSDRHTPYLARDIDNIIQNLAKVQQDTEDLYSCDGEIIIWIPVP